MPYDLFQFLTIFRQNWPISTIFSHSIFWLIIWLNVETYSILIFQFFRNSRISISYLNRFFKMRAQIFGPLFFGLALFFHSPQLK